MKTSKLEEQIIFLLKKNKIKVVREYQVKDLRNGLMRYDFFLPDKRVFLECHGPQHYEFNNYFYRTQTEFLKAKERDRFKISYALAHEIPLYTYPWFDMPQDLSGLFSPKYLVHNKYHNDNVWRAYKKQDK